MAIALKLDKKHVISPTVEDGLRAWVSGESGSGKSSACMLLVSQYLEQGGQVVVIDPHGEYGELWNVRPGGQNRVESFGYGGNWLLTMPDDPDKLQVDAAVERAVSLLMFHIEQKRSVLIDLSMWIVDQPAVCAQLVGQLVRTLYKHRIEKRGSTLMMVEEAHLFVPQTQSKGDAPNIKRFVNAVTGGRKFGLHFVLASQFPSLVDSNIVKQCNLRLFLRVSEQRDWTKVIRPYLPPRFAVTWAKSKKTDLSHFAPGEAILLCRWYEPTRLRLDRAEVPIRKFHEEEE